MRNRELAFLPEVSSETELGLLGVRIVDGIVHDDLHFLFRPKERLDLGIDGEIELAELTPDGKRVGTGRILAVQIKCGASFFSEEKDEHFVFRGKLKHLGYWTGFSLPVLVIICDPATRVAYWAEIIPRLVERTEAGWKINILKSNKLSTSRHELLETANRNYLVNATDLAAQAWFHARTKERVEFCGIFALPRDYHWYQHLVKIGDVQVMLHFLTARYGEFDVHELEEVLRYLPGNKPYGQRLIVGLISETIDAFEFSDEWNTLAQQAPDVEYRKLILDRTTCQVGELNAKGDVDLEYFEGEPIYSETYSKAWTGY